MAQVKVGDRVKIAEREPTNADVKSGLYYSYFGNLVGKIERTYDDNTVCVDIELETLPDGVRVRHQEMQTAARDKWVNGLAQEQRNRLSEADRQFRMSYKVLVASADVEPFKGGSPKGGAKKSGKVDTATTQSADSAPEPKSAKKNSDAPSAKTEPAPSGEQAKAGPKTVKTEPVHRLTEKDLEAREQEYLNSLQNK